MAIYVYDNDSSPSSYFRAFEQFEHPVVEVKSYDI